MCETPDPRDEIVLGARALRGLSDLVNEVSQAQDATALWIPQSVMVIGGGILSLALIDHLIAVIVHGNHRIERDLVDQSFGE